MLVKYALLVDFHKILLDEISTITIICHKQKQVVSIYF